MKFLSNFEGDNYYKSWNILAFTRKLDVKTMKALEQAPLPLYRHWQ